MKIKFWLILLIFLFVSFALTAEKETVILPANKPFIPLLNVSNFNAPAETKSVIEIKEEIKKPSSNTNISKKDEINSAPKETNSLPEKKLIKVPFTSQAPFGNWQPPFNETCEEAAIIMAAYWLSNKPLTAEIAEKEILGLVDYQKKKYGDYIDTTAAETARLANDFYQLDNFKIKERATIDNIVSELAKGNLVIAPMAGQILKNPYFRRPGPIYHLLLFVGYDKKSSQFITNDAGTKRGEGFRYSFKNIADSLADWDKEKKEPNSAHKTIIIVNEKNE